MFEHMFGALLKKKKTQVETHKCTKFGGLSRLFIL
jgi:hypothetical protein